MVAIFSNEEIDDFLSSPSISTSIDLNSIASTSYSHQISTSNTAPDFLKISKLELPLINFDLNMEDIDDSDIVKYLVKRETIITDESNDDNDSGSSSSSSSENSNPSSTSETSSESETSSSLLTDSSSTDNSTSTETSPINSTSNCISCASAPTCPIIIQMIQQLKLVVL
ncbi:unnamed protein product [[Candida] boidinii]|nr:unnamed protein product [[Candida] boidinii]